MDNSVTNVSSRLGYNDKPSVATDWRTVVQGEVHKGSFIWDDREKLHEEECKYGWLCKCLRKEKKAILKGPRVKIPKNIHIMEFMIHRLEKLIIEPTNTALIFGERDDESINFRELDYLSNAVGHSLLDKIGPNPISKNPEKDIVIAFCLPPSLQFISVIFAILKMGATYFPISTEEPEERIRNVITAVKPLIVIISNKNQRIYEIFQNYKSTPSEPESEGIQIQPESAEGPNLESQAPLTESSDPKIKDEEDPQIIFLEEFWDNINTGIWPIDTVPYIKSSKDSKIHYPPLSKRTIAIFSGSTKNGECYPVKYKSQSIFNMITWEWKTFKFNSDEKCLFQADPDSVLSLFEIFGPLLHGNALIITPEVEDVINPLRLLRTIKQYQLIRIDLWPTIFHSLLKALELLGIPEGRSMLSTVRYWFCLGGDLKLELAELFFSILPGKKFLINLYGDDEDLGAVCYQIIDSAEHVERLNFHSRLPVGTPLQNIRIYLIDDQNKVIRGNGIGEICVAGSKQLADSEGVKDWNAYSKFVNNPFAKSKEFQTLFRTGNYGRMIVGDFGQRFLVHEASQGVERMLQVDCREVDLNEIAYYVKRSKLVTDCHVIPNRASHEDQVIVAFCLLSQPGVIPEIESYLSKVLPPYMIPDLVEVDILPLTDNGAVNENHLYRLYYHITLQRKDFKEWSFLRDQSRAYLHSVKVLFATVYSMVGVSYNTLASSFYKPFLDIPRSSYSKAVFVTYELHRNRYSISLPDFIQSSSLASIAKKMADARAETGIFFLNPNVFKIEGKFKIQVINHENMGEVVDVLSYALTGRDCVDYYGEVNRHDLKRFIVSMWNMFTTKGLSKMVIRGEDKKVVGAIMNINWHDEIKPDSVHMSLEISYRLQLMQILELGFEETNMSATEACCLQIVYAALDSRVLSHLESHTLIERLIGETFLMAKGKGFDAIVFTTFNYFVTDICVNSFGFRVIRECQINQFVASDGRRPYSFAPDYLVGCLCFKKCT